MLIESNNTCSQFQLQKLGYSAAMHIGHDFSNNFKPLDCKNHTASGVAFPDPLNFKLLPCMQQNLSHISSVSGPTCRKSEAEYQDAVYIGYLPVKYH